LKQADFTTLISHLPNLKKITFYNDYFLPIGEYLHVLYEMADDDQYLNCVEEIDISAGKPDIYFLICYKLRRKITSLFLNRVGEKHTLNGVAGTAINFLHKFKKLVHLTVPDGSYGNGKLDMFFVLKICPQFVEI
jgi:hypothetical protein